MTTFLNKLAQHRAPEAPAASQQTLPKASAKRGEETAGAWRMVLEDGSTSACPEQSIHTAGSTILAEITGALQERVEPSKDSTRARGVAMPLSPRQPLHALDDSLISGPDAAKASDAGSGPLARPAMLRATAVEKQPACRAARSGATVLKAEPPGVFAAHLGSSRRDLDARLARVIDRWPRLPNSIRAAILAMVEAETAGT